jgi:hypothetical protein
VATFAQWQRAGCPAKRITWVCGPERVLADDVTDSVRAALLPPLQMPWLYFAGIEPERDIWAACAVIPSPGEQRLVIVRDAHKLRRPGELVPLVKAGREAAGTSLLFVSGETDFPRERDGDGKNVLAPHLAAIRDSRYGQLIRCVPPKDDDLLDWVARCWPGLGRNAAWRLLEAAHVDLGAVRAAGAKAVATGLTDQKYIPVLCEPPPGGAFAELLIRGDRAAALAAARTGQVPLGPAIGLLDSRLGTLAAIRDGQRRGLEDKDIAGRFGVPRFLISTYRDVAHAYGPARVRACRELLAAADAAWRTGGDRGVAEVLAASW